MSEPDFEQARRYALARLERELNPALCYHSIAHTRDEVVPATERLAAMEGCGGEDLLLLRTAAYFHDIGFVQRRDGHELAGIGIVEESLPQFGYSPAQIASVSGMILATRLPQTPTSRLAGILADSDLDLLGRDDFLLLNRMLRVEMAAFGARFTDAQWYSQQGAFVRQHRYWTDSARSLRSEGKERNIRALEALLASALAAEHSAD
jgi:uncharacterized protein